ncbi:MAG: cell division protein FtsZ [Candidatus Latescibacteria bacterium]|nr:cell division protein FtsZ [Candidatus Latescibacterota bacterium]
MFELVEPTERLARIRVAGVGGAGGNAINRMIDSGLDGVDFIAVNTDLQALHSSRADTVLQIGCVTTRGLGSGGDPDVGRHAVVEDETLVRDALEGSDMVFVTAGMGGGTGTGAAPVVARIARELGALTVGVVTKPFRFEGRVRLRQAEAGLAELRESVDTLIVIPNERLLEVVPPDTSMTEAFRFADTVLYEATRGIHDIIMKPHMVNLDFADVRSVMQGMGVALMGTGKATGENRAETAARAAISSPLLEDVDIRGAKGVLVNLTSAEVSLKETNAVMSLVQEAAGDQAHIIFGYGIEPDLGDTLQVTVIATGFDRGGVYEPVARPAAAAAPEPDPEPVVVAQTPVEFAEDPDASSGNETPVLDWDDPVDEPADAALAAVRLDETPAAAAFEAPVLSFVEFEPDFAATAEDSGFAAERDESPADEPAAAPPLLRVMAAAAGSAVPLPVSPLSAAPAAATTTPAWTGMDAPLRFDDEESAVRTPPPAAAGRVARLDSNVVPLREVRELSDRLAPSGRRAAVPVGEASRRDLSEPAYTRKYLD